MSRSLLSVLYALLIVITVSSQVQAQGYSASFQKANISEFINAVGITLNLTIITDPSVKGTVSVRSYNNLNKEQYYQLFLSVLEVHGFSVITESNNTIKVVKNSKTKETVFPIVDQFGNPDDSLVTWVLPINNIPARELAPILRQMNANYGNVVDFNPSNILIITGRAANVERLVSMVQRIDQIGAKSVVVVPLEHTSAKEMARILTSIYLNKTAKNSSTMVVVANEQGNQVILSGPSEMLSRMRGLAIQLDAERSDNSGNDRVFYLRYARAENLIEVLENAASVTSSSKGSKKNYSITAHEENNAIIITAQPDLMKSLAGLIAKLDIRRAQVMVEAIIAEVSDGDGINLSLQLAKKDNAVIQFNDGSSIPIGELISGVAEVNESGKEGGKRDYSSLSQVVSGLSGAAFAVTSGDWAALLQAVSTSSKSNVLSTPSLMTLDNQAASFVVGDEVPTITGSTSGSNNDNPYQTIERRQVGVKLSVTPRINEGDAVRLDIEQEVSKVNGRTSVDVTFSTREVKTSVMVRSGDTVVISGMIDDDVQESKSKVPLLGDIPLLGHAFRSTSVKTVKRNLMVFIRPTIIRNDDMMKTISANKYSLIRAEQLLQARDGVSLMPSKNTPVLPEVKLVKETSRMLPPEVVRQSIVEKKQEVLKLPAQPKAPEEQLQYHTVIKGNTLYSLARQYGTTVAFLRKINGLKGNTLSVGQRLIVARELVYLNRQAANDDETAGLVAASSEAGGNI